MFTTSSGGPGACTTAICSSEVIGTGIKGCKPTDNVSMSCVPKSSVLSAPKSGDPGDRQPSGVFVQILPRWQCPEQLPLSRPQRSFPITAKEVVSSVTAMKAVPPSWGVVPSVTATDVFPLSLP